MPSCIQTIINSSLQPIESVDVLFQIIIIKWGGYHGYGSNLGKYKVKSITFYHYCVKTICGYHTNYAFSHHRSLKKIWSNKNNFNDFFGLNKQFDLEIEFQCLQLWSHWKRVIELPTYVYNLTLIVALIKLNMWMFNFILFYIIMLKKPW